MKIAGSIRYFPTEVRILVASFLVVLSIGFFTGLLFVGETSSADPDGIEEQYLGNEADDNAEVMKFKKGEKEMLTIIHTHILSMALIFFLVGLLLCTTELHPSLKIFLIAEPFFSVVLTFGGLYLLWIEVGWMKYIVMFSGMLMTATYATSVGIILYQLGYLKNKI